MDAFVITDGERFMYENYQGKYVPAHCLDMADTYTKDQATTILNTYIPKSIRKIYRVEKVGTEEPENVIKSEDKKDVLIAPLTENEIKNNGVKVSDSKEIASLLEKVNDMNNFLESLENKKTQLCAELSKVDREISDWMHYIEFKSFNACQGYIAAKNLSECRKRRRLIKNEFQVLKEITNCTNSTGVNINKINSFVKNMDNRSYHPKENKMLFTT